MLTTYLFRYTIYFRMHHFVVKFSKFLRLRRKWGIDPLTKILRTFLLVISTETLEYRRRGVWALLCLWVNVPNNRTYLKCNRKSSAPKQIHPQFSSVGSSWRRLASVEKSRSAVVGRGTLKLQDWTMMDECVGSQLNLNCKISFLEKIFTPSPEKRN